MNVQTFIADSAAEAVEQIRAKLGPEAVVLNVRKLPVEGLARLWQKPRIEVVACLPEPAQPAVPTGELAALRQELTEIKAKFSQQESARNSPANPLSGEGLSAQMRDEDQPGVSMAALPPMAPVSLDVRGASGWRVETLLARSGLQPVHVQRVLDEIRGEMGDEPPRTLAEELDGARTALLRLWRRGRGTRANRHLFVGPPGVGKTTVLSKWLAQAVLVEGRRARVWRLDGQVANTAEGLSVFAEILGVPVERTRPDPDPSDDAELVLVDMPGVNAWEAAAIGEMKRVRQELKGVVVHLVLNAAYEGHLLVGQGRVFSQLGVDDVIVTHLDEERRWGKLWDLVLGTNYTVAYLSAGQNIPGEFGPADPEKILAGQLRGK